MLKSKHYSQLDLNGPYGHLFDDSSVHINTIISYYNWLISIEARLEAVLVRRKLHSKER